VSEGVISIVFVNKELGYKSGLRQAWGGREGVTNAG